MCRMMKEKDRTIEEQNRMMKEKDRTIEEQNRRLRYYENENVCGHLPPPVRHESACTIMIFVPSWQRDVTTYTRTRHRLQNH